ncbi:isoprenoid synthase domain-containing protein [Cokeromyces recurvatus]|uniref:isoprenoid synthase domain-containing protein n=1 Tax=Cokeromyces recurvatus TaxID=90255 RepID=UPI00221FD79C|nr:isoprenoid synthase domain-containing protein [Cokeromyces recurvatus]KAI7900035.1 isoprenoid synthase domain-containing protein [Cokeromyces recurvatus]
MILSFGNSIRIATKSFRGKRLIIRPTTVASYHESKRLLKKATKLEEIDDSPFDKLAQGMNAIKSTILNVPPLRKVTRPNIESLPFTGQPKSWDEAVKEAQGLVISSPNQERILDPIKLLGKDIWELKGNITSLLGSGHPFIKTIGKHYFKNDTNRIRPLLVLLMAKATFKKPGFGNKMAILAGDFLLARASLALSTLRNAECIDLIAQSCKASSVLAGCTSDIHQIAYTYGKHFGIALQLIDDVHIFTKSPSKIEAKLHSSEYITAPLLLAWEEFPELGSLIERQFKQEGDIEKARILIYKSNGLKKTLLLAKEHIELATTAIEKLAPSDAQTALIQLAKNLPSRNN